MKKTFAFALLAAFSAGFAFAQGEDMAQERINQSDVDEQNRLSSPEAVRSASDMLEEWKADALAQLKVEEGNADGKFVIFKSATVSLKDTDPQYGDALANAFDVAMLEAQQQMLMDRFGQLVTEKSRETFRDNSTRAREIPWETSGAGAGAGSTSEKAMRILDKEMALAEAKLDQALEEYGVPRAEYQTATPEKKKTLFKNALVKETIKKASGEIAGLFPVQTCVKKDAKGVTKVGVILVMSPKSVQVATDIRLQRNSLISGRGADLHQKMVPQTEAQWIGQLGTRLVYDQAGRPAIVSYGMGAYTPYGDDDYINDELKEEARKQALDNADAQIAEVVAGRMSAETSRLQSETTENAVSREMRMDSATIDSTIKDIVKQSRSFAKSQAKMQMAGLTTMGSKFIKLPSGQEVCYVIRVWTYGGLESVKKLNQALSAGRHTEPDRGTGVPGQFDGFLVNDMDDF